MFPANKFSKQAVPYEMGGRAGSPVVKSNNTSPLPYSIPVVVAHVLQVVLHVVERARVFCYSLVTLLTKLPNQSYIDPSCLSYHVMHSSRRQELHDCCMTIASNSQTSSCCCAREHQSSGGDAR